MGRGGPRLTDVPPMSPADLDVTRDGLHAHAHAVCVYEREDEMSRSLSLFIEGGVRQGETSVFVHSFVTDEEAWMFLLRAHPGADQLRADQLVLVSLYRDAFQGGAPRIDHEHVGRVVGGLVEQARLGRRAGVRIFVDASRRYFSEARVREWFDFEEWLGRRLQASVGLVCAYRREDIMRPDLLPLVLRTHSYRFGA